MDMQYACDNVFPKLKCVAEPFLLKKSPISTQIQVRWRLTFAVSLFRRRGL